MSGASGRNLKAILKQVGSVPTPELPGGGDPTAVLLLSYLMWESTTARAREAYQRLTGRVADFNDLRVSMAHEIAEMMGDRSALAQERASRLRATLRDIYLREHEVSLLRLQKQGSKRDIRKYIETLDGVVPYVAARVQLLCFETHAIPVDEQLRRLLLGAGVVEEGSDLAAVAAWLARHVKAEEGIQTHHQLQAWVDRAAEEGRTKKRPGERTKKQKSVRRET